jgi:uncharacterized membrane protein (DUF4010 family)
MAVAAITGLADVDAVALSVPLLAPASVSFAFAAQAVLVAVAVNICAKSAYAVTLGGARFGVPFTAVSLAAGFGAALLVLLM